MDLWRTEYLVHSLVICKGKIRVFLAQKATFQPASIKLHDLWFVKKVHSFEMDQTDPSLPRTLGQELNTLSII
jgi:hypothetical protein